MKFNLIVAALIIIALIVANYFDIQSTAAQTASIDNQPQPYLITYY